MPLEGTALIHRSRREREERKVRGKEEKGTTQIQLKFGREIEKEKKRERRGIVRERD